MGGEWWHSGLGGAERWPQASGQVAPPVGRLLQVRDQSVVACDVFASVFGEFSQRVPEGLVSGVRDQLLGGFAEGCLQLQDMESNRSRAASMCSR